MQFVQEKSSYSALCERTRERTVDQSERTLDQWSARQRNIALDRDETDGEITLPNRV